jgi:malate synthase
MHMTIVGARGGLEIAGPPVPGLDEILTPDACAFLATLHRTFEDRRRGLLADRERRQAEIDAGAALDFRPETAAVRADDDWRVAPAPADLEDRRVEITGPLDRKMMINALNSGARVFMADCEDATSPTWENMVAGQVNLRDAAAGTIAWTAPDGRAYALRDDPAVLLVRPRGWHLVEKHAHVDGAPISGSLFDFGLYLFHNAARLAARGSGPYFYLPKLQGHREARLWNDVFVAAQAGLGIPRGTIRATVLIETLPAAFEMDEILHELREHAAGLNAGRWDYIFSVIKTCRNRAGFCLPDRARITMTVPFMRAYTELLVRTCHRRGAHAIGGMAAFIPSRRDPEVTRVALEQVRADKERESKDGCDGTWVAHPDLVPVATEVFDAALGDRPHQKDRLRADVDVGAADLTNFEVEGGITAGGFRHNVDVALRYLAAWLRGSGCVPLYNLMEDAATAEICRAQLWQWIHCPGARLEDGAPVDRALYDRTVPAALAAIRDEIGADGSAEAGLDLARRLLDRVAAADEFADFLTSIAYDHLD